MPSTRRLTEEELSSLKDMQPTQETTPGQEMPEQTKQWTPQQHLEFFNIREQFTQPFYQTGDFYDTHSRYDEGAPLDQVMKPGGVQDWRAQQQPALHKWATVPARFAITAGTTFVAGTLGTLWGGMEAMGGGNFIDNKLSNTMLDIQDWSNEIMPTYRFTEEEEVPWYKRIASKKYGANFWGDIVVNQGFTAGTVGAAAVTGGVLGSATRAFALGRGVTGAASTKRLAALSRGIKRGTIDPNTLNSELLRAANTIRNADVATQWLSSLHGSTGYARIEALGHARELDERLRGELEMEFTSPEYRDTVYNELRMQNPDMDEFQLNRLVSDRIDTEYEQKLNSLDDIVRAHINTTFATDLFYLTITNQAMFGRMFSGNYGLSKNTIARNIVPKAGIEQVRKNPALLKEGFESVVSGGDKARRAAGHLLKNPTVQFFEESFLHINRESSGDYYEAMFNEEATHDMNEFRQGYWDKTIDTFGNIDNWESGVMGFLGGGLGALGPVNRGGRRYGMAMQGGIWEAYREMRNTNDAATESAIEMMNQRVKDDDNLTSLYRASVRRAVLDKKAKQAVQDESTFDFDNATFDSFVNDFQLYEDLGLLSEFVEMMNIGNNITATEARELFKKMPEAQAAEGQEVSPVNVDVFANMSDEEIESTLRGQNKTIQRFFTTVSKANEDIGTLVSALTFVEDNEQVDQGIKQVVTKELTRLVSSIDDMQYRIEQVNSILSPNVIDVIESTTEESKKERLRIRKELGKDSNSEILKKADIKLAKEFIDRLQARISEAVMEETQGDARQSMEMFSTINKYMQLSARIDRYSELYNALLSEEGAKEYARQVYNIEKKAEEENRKDALNHSQLETNTPEQQAPVQESTASPNTYFIRGDNKNITSKKLTLRQAETNDYKVDESGTKYPVTEERNNLHKNNFSIVYSPQAKSIKTEVENTKSDKGENLTVITFEETNKDGSKNSYKSYNNVSELREDFTILQRLGEDFVNSLNKGIQVKQVVYGPEHSFITVGHEGVESRIVVKNKDREYAIEEGHYTPSVYTKNDHLNNITHSVITDSEGNIVRDTLSKKIEGMLLEDNREVDVTMNFVNNELTSIDLFDTESGITNTFKAEDNTSFFDKTDQELKQVLVSEYGLLDGKPIEQEVVPEDVSRTRGQLKDKIKQSTVPAIITEINSNKDEIKKVLQNLVVDGTQWYELISNPEWIRNLYSDSTFDNVSVKALFSDGTIKYIPSIYQGEIGYLEVDNGQLIFKTVTTDTGSVTKEFIISGIDSLETLGNLDVNILKDVPFEMEFMLDGRPFDINIQGVYYANKFQNSLEAITYNAAGDPVGITLWNTLGEKVEITNPFVVYNVAYNIELANLVEQEVFDNYLKTDSDFVVYTHEGVDYAVYRKNNNKYSILNIGTERPITGKLYSSVKEGFLTEMHATIAELTKSGISANNNSKKQIQDEVNRIAQAFRTATSAEISRLADKPEVRDPKTTQEEKTRKKKDDVIEDVIHEVMSQEAAENKVTEKHRQELQKEEAERAEMEEDASVRDTIDPTEFDNDVSPGELEIPELGIRSPHTAIAYVHFDRDTQEYKVNNEAFHTAAINAQEKELYFTPEPDYLYNEFWDKHPGLKEEIQKGKLSEKRIQELLSITNEKDFTNIVDEFPIKLAVETPEGNFSEAVHMHSTAYDKIAMPKHIAAIKDIREQRKAYEEHVRTEQLTNRQVRKQVLGRLLSGELISIQSSNKTLGSPNTVGKRNNIGDILQRANPNVDLRNVTLAVATRPGAIYKNKTETTETVARASTGNVFLETEHTANPGKKGVIKLNPSKISAQHAGLILKVFQEVYTKDSGGFVGKYKGPEVTGELTRGEVLRFLVHYIDQEEATKRNRKAHIKAKDLWVENAKILHFGDQKIPLHTTNPAEVKRFVEWAVKNKNYAINKSMLGNKVKGKEVFNIAGFTYDSTVDNYNSFLIKNNILTTDVDIVPGTSSLFRHPVVGLDLSSAGIDGTSVKVDGNTIDKYKGQRQAPLSKPVETQEAAPVEQPETIETTSKDNNESVDKAYGRTLANVKEVGGLNNLPVGSVVYIGSKEDGQVVKNHIGKIVRSTTGKIGIKINAVPIHWALPNVFKSLNKLGSFSLDDAALRKQFNNILANFKNDIYFDSPAKPADHVTKDVKANEAIKEVPKEVQNKIEHDYQESTVEEQLKNTTGRKYLDTEDTGDTNLDDIGFSPFRETVWGAEDYQIVNIEKELKRVHSILRLNKIGKQIPVELVDKLIKIGTNRHAFAQFRHDAFVLSRLAEEGSLLHEAFHRVSLGYLTDIQRQQIYNEAREVYKLKGVEDSKVEEVLAEKFREYSLLRENTPEVTPKLGIGQRISKFFNDLFNFIHTWFTGETKLDSYTIENLFRAIDTGRFKYARISSENLNKIKGKAYNLEVKETKLDTIQTPQEYREVIKNLFFLLAESNRLVDTADGQVSVSISDFNDIKRIKFGPLYKSVETLRSKYNTVAIRNDRAVEKIKSGKISSIEFLDIKRKFLGESKLHYTKENTILELQTQSDIALRSAYVFDEIYTKFDVFKAGVEDFMQGLNIRAKNDNSDVDAHINDEETGETSSDFENYNRSSYETSSKENTALSIKILISMLPEDNKRSPLTGLYNFTDFSRTWSRLINDLLGTVNMEDMIDRITKLSTDNFTYQTLLKRLENDENLKTQFWKTMQKYKHNFVNFLVDLEEADTPSYRIVTAAVQQTVNRYVQDWGKAFIFNKAFFKPSRGKDLQGDISFYNELVQEFDNIIIESKRQLNNNGEILDLNSKITQIVDLLNSINIPVDNNTIRTALLDINDISESASFVSFLDKKIPYLFNENSTLAKLINGESLIDSKGKRLSPEKGFSKESSIKYLADIYTKAQPFEMGDSVFGPQGNRYYTISQNTYISDVLRELKSDVHSFIDKAKGSRYSRHSQFIRALEENPELTQKIELLSISAFQREDTYDTGRGYQGITNLEDTLMRITAIESGKLVPPTPADRKFFYFYDGFNPLEIRLDENGNIADNVLEVFHGYYKDEVNRILAVRNEIDTALEGKLDSSELFETYHFRYSEGATGVGTLDGNKILKDAKGKYVGRGANFTHFAGMSVTMTRKESKAAINDILKARIQDTTKMMVDLGILQGVIDAEGNITSLSNALLSEKHLHKYINETLNEDTALQSIVANFALNTMYSAIETGKVFTGDPAAFKSSEDYVKRLPGYTSTGENLRTDFPSGYFQGERLIHGDEYNVTTFTSHLTPNDIVKELIEIHANYYLENNIANTKEQALNIAKEKLKDLEYTDQTDAQTYITPEMYRAISIRLGEWSDKKEQAYQLINKESRTKEEDLLLNSVLMQPLKMTYMDIIYRNGHAIPVFDKMSMATLYRPMVQGTRLEAILDRMEGKGEFEGQTPVDQVKFHTAEKVGGKDRRKLFADDTETDFTNLSDISIYPQSFKRLKNQLITDPHMTNRIPMGSQVKKVGMANIIAEGIYNRQGQEIFGEDLRREINQIIGELSTRGKESLFKNLDINTQTGKFNSEEVLVNKLREEARSAQLPDYIVEAFKLGEDGKMYISIDAFPGNRKWIQSRIISLVKKAAIDLELPGNSFIQMSDLGLNKIDKSDQLKIDLNKGTIQAKVSVNLFRTLIPKYNSLTHEERVAYLKAHKDLLSLGYRVPTQGQNSIYLLEIVDFLPSNTGDTIVLPKEGPGLGGFDFDIDKMYVVRSNYRNGEKVRFLDDTNSTVEERAQAFTEEALREDLSRVRREYSDALKETFAKVADYKDAAEYAKDRISELSEYLDLLFGDEFQDAISLIREQKDIKEANFIMKKQAYAEIDALKKELDSTVANMKKEWLDNNMGEFTSKNIIQQNTREAVENQLLDSYYAVLTNEHHIIRRTTPLGYTANIMKNLAAEIRKWKGVKEDVTEALTMVSPLYQLDVKARYKFGGEGIGAFALANVHHILGQISELGLFDYLGIGHQKNNVTDLSQILGEDDIDILEWFSGLIDAHVDIAADPYIYYLNVNEYTRDLVSLLIRAGVGGEKTLLFTSQPILVDIAKLSENRKNKIGLSIFSPEDTIREKYESLMWDKIQTGFTLKEFNPADMSKIFSRNSLESLLKTSPEKATAEYYNNQLIILDAFQYINRYAEYLKEATLTSRVDTKKFGSSYSEIVGFKNRILKAYDDMNKGVGIRNYDRLMEDTYLNELTENSVEVIQSLLSNITVEGTVAFQNALNKILTATNNLHSLDSTLIPKVVDEVYNSMYSEFFEGYLDSGKVNRMLFGENTIAKNIEDIRAGRKFKRLQNNLLVRTLEPVYKEGHPDLLALSKPDNKWYRDDMSRAWKEIFAGSAEERAFATDLFYYSYLTSGFKGTINSFHELVPSEIVKFVGLDRFIKQKLSDYVFNEEALSGAITNMFVNNWQDDSLVPNLKNIDGRRTGSYKGTEFSVITSQNNLLRGTNEAGEPVYAPYVRRGRRRDLYKYIGYIADTKEAVYVIEEKKGYKGDRGLMVRENVLKRSLFENNRLDNIQNIKPDLTPQRFSNLIDKSQSLTQKYKGFQPITNMNISNIYRPELETTSSVEQTRMDSFNVIDVPQDIINQIEGGTKEINIQSEQDLSGFRTLPNGRIVFLERIEGNNYSVQDYGMTRPTNEAILKRIKEC